MNYKEEINNKGYIILENIFDSDFITKCRDEILNFIKNNKTLKNSSGIGIPDFINNKSFPLTSSIKDNKKINNVLSEIFNNNYRFCQHNDIGVNRVVGWHKDKLNGVYSKFETVDIYNEHNGEKHEIVKVLIYLQDHSKDDYALKIVPFSHKDRNIITSNFIQLRPKLGDVIIFDQRITHRGMSQQVKDPRILVAFGFGKNNIFTDNFEKGTIARQNDYNKSI